MGWWWADVRAAGIEDDIFGDQDFPAKLPPMSLPWGSLENEDPSPTTMEGEFLGGLVGIVDVVDLGVVDVDVIVVDIIVVVDIKLFVKNPDNDDVFVVVIVELL